MAIGREQLDKWKKEQVSDKKRSYGINISKQKWFKALSGLSSAEKDIYVSIWLYADKEGYCWPSMRQLAEDLGLDKNTIQKHISTLKEKRFLKIKIKKGTRGKRFEYWLLK